MRNWARVPILSIVLAAAANPLFAAPADEIFISRPGGVVTHAVLPSGTATPLIPIGSFEIKKLFAMPGGELLVAATVYSPQYVTLGELLPDGSLRHIAYLPNWNGVFEPLIEDMDLDSRGRLFLLHRFGASYPISFLSTSLVEIEPSTGRYGAGLQLPNSVPTPSPSAASGKRPRRSTCTEGASASRSPTGATTEPPAGRAWRRRAAPIPVFSFSSSPTTGS